MKTILSSQNYVQKITSLTDQLFYAFERWDGDEMNVVFKKIIFENLLADYHSFKLLNKSFESFKLDLNYDFSGTDLFLHLNIDSFVDASLPLTLWKNAKVNEALDNLQQKRKKILSLLENFLAKEELDNKIIITKTLVNWHNTIKRINSKFFLGRVKAIESELKKMEINYFYSTDIFRTFQNFTNHQQDNPKRILILTSFVNYLSIPFWFEGYEVTLVSNQINQLVSISFSSNQLTDLINQNIFQPSTNFKNTKFTVLFDDELLLKRFNRLEEKSYSACMVNFIFSADSKIDAVKIKLQIERIKSLMKTNTMILIQEASLIESLMDEIFAQLDIKVILKVRFIENTEITNWLVMANKI
jgi:hypothetical protein